MTIERKCETCEHRYESLLLGIARWPDRKDSFAVNQLPNMVNLPTVMLRREQLQRFRDQYAMLLEFAAVVCGVGKTELAPIHMMVFLAARARSTHDGEAGEGGGA